MKSEKAKSVLLNSTQRKYVINRLQQIRMAAWRNDRSKTVKPSTITKAEAELTRLREVVDKWNSIQYAARQKLDEQLKQEIFSIEEKLLFSGAEEALTLIKAFEEKWGAK